MVVGVLKDNLENIPLPYNPNNGFVGGGVARFLRWPRMATSSAIYASMSVAAEVKGSLCLKEVTSCHGSQKLSWHRLPLRRLYQAVSVESRHEHADVLLSPRREMSGTEVRSSRAGIVSKPSRTLTLDVEVKSKGSW